MTKTIKYEDFDQAVKTAYSLGKLDGEAGVRTLLDDMRIQLGLMLKTNKNLNKLLLEEHHQERTQELINLSPRFVRGALRALHKASSDPPTKTVFYQLQTKYEAATGKKYKGAGQ